MCGASGLGGVGFVCISVQIKHPLMPSEKLIGLPVIACPEHRDKSESIISFKILIVYDNNLACKLIDELLVIVAGVACVTYATL